jgi:hypothetical protein
MLFDEIVYESICDLHSLSNKTVSIICKIYRDNYDDLNKLDSLIVNYLANCLSTFVYLDDLLITINTKTVS